MEKFTFLISKCVYFRLFFLRLFFLKPGQADTKILLSKFIQLCLQYFLTLLATPLFTLCPQTFEAQRSAT